MLSNGGEGAQNTEMNRNKKISQAVNE